MLENAKVFPACPFIRRDHDFPIPRWRFSQRKLRSLFLGDIGVFLPYVTIANDCYFREPSSERRLHALINNAWISLEDWRQDISDIIVELAHPSGIAVFASPSDLLAAGMPLRGDVGNLTIR